jgi:pyridoxal phosphate enzyme (YggS family)
MERIGRAAQRVGRDPNEVTLVAVTKYVGPEVVRVLYDLGLRDFGESRPQVIWEKRPMLADDVRWHLIGHLQTNKIRRTLPMVQLIHSVDRLPLAEELSQESLRIGKRSAILVEAKLVADESKHGFNPERLTETLGIISTLPGVEVKGLMSMASLSDNPEEARPVFRQLRSLRDRMAEKTSLPLKDLSMGMSQDFEVAIEEGATLVRVGSILFDGLMND